mgnify:FL=1
MIISEMEIRLRADIARLQRDMDSARQVVGNATAGMERAAAAAKAALAGIAAGLGGRELVRITDEYTKYTAQLKLATGSEREYAQARSDTRRIANGAQQDLGATGMLYARIANGTRELGVAQSRVADITEVVNLALKVSGAAASESASAQLQLSQAFASGTLRGEEFNAVNEAAPRLMKALADGMGMPVGALKKMAEEGKITSGIMAEVLPGALTKLREESKEVQTISGAFTVLRNNVMEFVGVQAQANGAVAALTGGLTLLADNLALVAGTALTIGAAKLGSIIGEWVASTYRQVTAAVALRAATIASAEAEVASTGAKLAQLNSTQAMIVVAREEAAAKLVSSNANITAARTAIAAAEAAGAQSFALRTVRLATAELTVAEAQRSAMLAELAILGRQQASVSAQITVATAAQAAAQTGLNAATGAGIGSAGLASRALGFLGGPIGAVITLLGLAATAWMVWGNKSKEGNEKAAESFDEAHSRIIKGLDEQIAKNEKLLQMRNLGATKSEAEKALPFVTQLAAASERLNQINNRTGEFASQSNTEVELERIKVLRAITEQTEKMAAAEKGSAAVSANSVAERVAAFKKEHATKQEQMAAELKAIADLKGKTGEYAEMERRIREKYADKGAAAALKQEQTAYSNLITSIHEKLAANDLELSGYDKLSESQKMTIKLDAAIGTGKSKLSAEHVKETRAMIAKVEAQEQAIEAQQRTAKWAEIEAKNDSDHYDRLRASTAAIDDRIKQMEREIETYGLTESAAIEMEKAKLEAKLALGPATYAELIALDEQIAKMGKLAELAKNKEVLDASKKAADQIVEDQKRVWGDVERTAHDTFISIFDSGKSAFDRLKDALKNGLLDLLYQMTVRKWIVNISGQVSGQGGLTQAASLFGGSGRDGSALGNAMSLVSMGKTIYSGFTGGIASSLGGWVSSAGSMFGSTAATAFGTGMSSPGAAAIMGELASGAAGASTGTAAAGSAAAGASTGAYAIPIAGWIAAGMALSNSLYKQGWNAENGSLTDSLGGKAIMPFNAPMLHLNQGLQKLGLSNSLANMLSGASTVSALFGRKDPKVESQGLRGTVSASGFDGDTYANIVEKGGLFRSTKRYTTGTPLSSDQDATLDGTVQAMIQAVKGFGSAMGLETSVITGYTKAITLELGADEAKNQEAIAKMFGEIGDELSLRLVPSIASLGKTGETASATLQRVASDYAAVDSALSSISKQFGQVGVQSLTAREHMVDLFGGADAFMQSTAAYAQNFLTEAERMKPVADALSVEMSRLGLVSVTTRAQFKQVIDGLNVSTDAGAAQ